MAAIAQGILEETATEIPMEVPASLATLRDDKRCAFLAAAGWGDLPLNLLVEEGSFRKYYRLEKGGRSIVLLDSPHPNAPQERLPNVVSYAQALNGMGLRAPTVYEADLGDGFALIEDFGGRTCSRLFDQQVDKRSYLKNAMDCLIHLHRNFDPAAMPDLGNAFDYFMSENPHFTNWFWPARNHHETPPDIVAEYEGLWSKLLVNLPPVTPTMCMTDYHAPNLMDLGGEGLQSVGIIDFQDSILASPVYDVVSLLEDDRRDLDDETGLALRQYYRNAMRDRIDGDLFDLHYAVLSAQRHAKNMGNFVRIAVQKNAPRWLDYIPVATKWFDRALHSHDYLAPMQKWFARYSADYKQPLENVRFFLK